MCNSRLAYGALLRPVITITTTIHRYRKKSPLHLKIKYSVVVNLPQRWCASSHREKPLFYQISQGFTKVDKALSGQGHL